MRWTISPKKWRQQNVGNCYKSDKWWHWADLTWKSFEAIYTHPIALHPYSVQCHIQDANRYILIQQLRKYPPVVFGETVTPVLYHQPQAQGDYFSLSQNITHAKRFVVRKTKWQLAKGCTTLLSLMNVNLVSKGFGPALWKGLSRRFQSYPTTHVWVSCQLPSTGPLAYPGLP